MTPRHMQSGGVLSRSVEVCRELSSSCRAILSSYCRVTVELLSSYCQVSCRVVEARAQLRSAVDLPPPEVRFPWKFPESWFLSRGQISKRISRKMGQGQHEQSQCDISIPATDSPLLTIFLWKDQRDTKRDKLCRAHQGQLCEGRNGVRRFKFTRQLSSRLCSPAFFPIPPGRRRPTNAAAAAFMGWLAFANSNWRGGSPARSKPSIRPPGRQPPAAATHCWLGFERV